MHLLQLVRCATGRHVRSGRRSQIVDGRRENVCRGCGRRMVEDNFALQLVNSAVVADLSKS